MKYYLLPISRCYFFEVPDPDLIAWPFCPLCGFRNGTHTHTCVYLPSYPHTHMHTVICSPTQERTEWADLCAVLVSQQLHMTVQRKARGAACQANGLVWAGEGEACWEKKAMEGQKCNLLLDIRAWPPSWRGLSGWGETGRQFHVCPLE